MKTLAPPPIHLRALLRLCDCYGEQAFLAAAARAQEYRRCDARAVERILERTGPPPDADPPAPLSGQAAALLGEVEPGSLDAYAGLDGADGPQTDTEDDHGS